MGWLDDEREGRCGLEERRGLGKTECECEEGTERGRPAAQDGAMRWEESGLSTQAPHGLGGNLTEGKPLTVSRL